MTVKPIRWFEVPAAFPAAFYNPDPKHCVVCLRYKDYNDLAAGVRPRFLTHKVVDLPLISRWEPHGHWGALERGAQDMVTYAASNSAVGFQDGDFYGIYQVYQGVDHRPEVLIGLAYAETPLLPFQGMIENSNPFGNNHGWVTPQFAIPFQFEVQLMEDSTKVKHRASRYKRDPVI